MKVSLWAEIRRLYEVEKLSQRAIAQRLRCGTKTVRKVLRTTSPPLLTTTPAPPPPNGILKPYHLQIDGLIAKYPDLSAVRVLEEISRGPEGFCGSVYPVRRYLHKIRPVRGRVYQEVVYEPGEAMQVDWGDCGLLTIGQTTRRVSVFVAVLCFSRLCYIEFTLSQHKTVTLRVGATQLRIIDQGQEVAVHQRCYEKGQLVTHRDHRLEALKMRRRRRAGQWETEFDALGPTARQFHLKLLSMPVKVPRHLGRLLALVRLYGRKEVLAAIGQALEYQTYDAAYVEALILQQRRRRDLPSPIPLRPKRSELIEDIHLEEPDPARYDRLFGSSNNKEHPS